MAEPDLLIPSPALVSAVPAQHLEAPAADHPHRSLRAGFGALLTSIGLASFVVAGVWTGAAGGLRAGLALAGVFVAIAGIGRLGKALAGPKFDTGFWVSVAWLTLVVLAAIFVQVLPLSEYKDVSKTLAEPTLLRPDFASGHPLGTDRQGLDLLGGVMYGARVSLVVGIGGVALGLIVGSLLGIAAGYYRGKVDSVIALFTDSMLAFPPLIFLLGLVAVMHPNLPNLTIALAVLGVPTWIRLARANTLVVSQREFVLAARALGCTNRRIITRELVPNVALPVVSFGFIVVAALIVAEASLSFLGLGIQRPTPTWGNMIAAGQSSFQDHPHLIFIPGSVLFATVFALNKLGDRAREQWDPRRSAL